MSPRSVSARLRGTPSCTTVAVGMLRRQSFAQWQPRFFERSALFAPIAGAAVRFVGFADFPPVAAWNEALGAQVPVRFVEQPPMPRRRRARRGALDPANLYDARIHDQRIVPSRPAHWHDFLNALVWAAFPRAKSALHARQHRAIAARIDPLATTLPGARTRELDALALLDEGGVLALSEQNLPTDAALEEALANGSARLLVFGHAIYEALVAGVPLGTARAAVIRVPAVNAPLGDLVNAADALFAALLSNADRVRDPATLPRLLLREQLGIDAPQHGVDVGATQHR